MTTRHWLLRQHPDLTPIRHRAKKRSRPTGGILGDPVVATAILDRLLHHSTVITIRGDSYRLREKRRSGLLQKAGTTLDTNETAKQ